MCKHETTYLSSHYYMCPHTSIYLSSTDYIFAGIFAVVPIFTADILVTLGTKKV
jgi:hypothetical protein